MKPTPETPGRLQSAKAFLALIDSGLVGRKVSRGEKMALRGTDPESYNTEHTLVYEDWVQLLHGIQGRESTRWSPRVSLVQFLT